MAAEPQTAGGERLPMVLARGPWGREQVGVRWCRRTFEPNAEQTAQADAAIARLREQGSPSHDGLAGRLKGFAVNGRQLELELQPSRWSLRLVRGDAARSLSVLCVARAADGRFLAGRRAGWVASWAGRWTLGAAGAVDPFEHPYEALARELEEEWSVTPRELRGEALIELPHGLVMFVGQAFLAPGADRAVKPDHEHDRYAWWPADVDRWPAEAGEPLKAMARLLER